MNSLERYAMYTCMFHCEFDVHIGSGSSLMLDMTQLPMPIILLCHVYQEGKYSFCVQNCVLCTFYLLLLQFSMHTIVGITTLSRDDHITAQTREYECTRHVLPQVLARGIISSLCCCVFSRAAIL